uniref:Uncharacterized protein n=1 Tax=Romanomermis culicivorax TaxID=13658 RepID=A0A915JIU0_ROMCU
MRTTDALLDDDNFITFYLVDSNEQIGKINISTINQHLLANFCTASLVSPICNDSWNAINWYTATRHPFDKSPPKGGLLDETTGPVYSQRTYCQFDAT